MEIKTYMVGGCVRDEIMGIESDDIDFTVVAESLDAMREYILGMGGKIFLDTPEYFTIRAKVGKETYDFVWARKESGYTDRRHPDVVEQGTLEDDLARRDFTINAIAKDSEGNLIDPFNGMEDIKNRIIRCVGNTRERIMEDCVRLLRAARFSITKAMSIHPEIEALFFDEIALHEFAEYVDQQRIYKEVLKMFKHDTFSSMKFFAEHPDFSRVCFDESGLWLKVTNEKM